MRVIRYNFLRLFCADWRGLTLKPSESVEEYNRQSDNVGKMVKKRCTTLFHWVWFVVLAKPGGEILVSAKGIAWVVWGSLGAWLIGSKSY